MTPAEKAQHLIAKAVSTDSEEEARTCALTAARLIVKEGLTVVSEAPSLAFWPPPQYTPPRREPPSAADIFNDIFGSRPSTSQPRSKPKPKAKPKAKKKRKKQESKSGDRVGLGEDVGIAECVRHTDKAILVRFEAEVLEHWVPKSQIHEASELRPGSPVGKVAILIVTEWFAKTKEWGRFRDLAG